MKVKDIRIGTRHRQHVGDVRTLAASIAKLGLLHPVVVDSKGRLVAGARRLAAVRSLGWKDVPVRVVRTLTDAASALRAERDENTERKSFLPSELVSITRALEPLERAEAKGRQGTRTDRHPGKLPASVKGDRRDKLAAVVGVSGRTLEKAKAVVAAAEQDPKKFGRLLHQMDRTGNVRGTGGTSHRVVPDTIRTGHPPRHTTPTDFEELSNFLMSAERDACPRAGDMFDRTPNVPGMPA